MSDLSIKITIAGRVYPLTIEREEEEIVRLAAKKIDDAVKDLQKNYAVKDKQDLLAMAALQVGTSFEKTDRHSGLEEIESKLSAISTLLND